MTNDEDLLIESMRLGIPWWLAKEAIASTKMSHDREQTYIIDEVRNGT